MSARRFGRLIGCGLATFAAAFSLTACGVITGQQSEGDAPAVRTVPQEAPTAPPKPTTAASGAATPRSATVEKGSIVETMSLDSLVVAQDQVPVLSTGVGLVADVKVKGGQTVGEGDDLIEFDSAELLRALDGAKARLEVSTANLAQAQAQLAAIERTAAQRQAALQSQQQLAVADAQSGVRKAQDQLAVVMGGASETERRAAATVVMNAQAEVQKALAAQDKLAAGPDPAAIRAATNDVTSAKIAAQRAQADLDTLVKGVDPGVLAQAQRDVDRAQTLLQIAQAAKPDPKADPNTAKLTRDSAIADATNAVQEAQGRLAKLKEPPSVIDVQAAKFKVQTAQDLLAAATDKLSALQGPADQATVDAAQAAVDRAQQGVDDAQAKLDAVNRRPTPSEVADAQAQLGRAQAALDAARSPAAQSDDGRGVDVNALQQTVEADKANVAKLEDQVQNNRVTAPFAGMLLSVRVKVGDKITSGKPIAVLAKPGPAIVRAQVADDQVARLTVGQKADLVLDNAAPSDPKIAATVASVTPAPKDGTGFPSADFTVDWPSGPAPKIGTPVVVNLLLREKEDVLVIPKSAVRQAGSRTYVEVLDGSRRRVANIELGIAAVDRVEVVTGLTEGQVVSIS